MSSLKGMYDQVVNMIVRPPRVEYNIADLGPETFAVAPRQVSRRTDFTVLRKRTPDDKSATSAAPPATSSSASTSTSIFSRNKNKAAAPVVEEWRIECSFFGPATLTKGTPCNVVIYCHGNAGCRLDATDIVPLLLPHNICVVALDFIGSGLSSGEFVTLGWNEQKDLAAVVAYLRDPERAPFTVAKIALWGRSMGAVTSLMCLRADPSIAAAVLDSPYSDLPLLCRQLVSHVITVKLPGFAVSTGLRIVRSSAKSRAGVDIMELTPIKFVGECHVPALFCHGENDDFVKPMHSRALHDAYGGEKSIHIVAGDHNSPRPDDFQETALLFLCNALGVTLNSAAPRASASASFASTSTTQVSPADLSDALKMASAAALDQVVATVCANSVQLPPDAGALLLTEGVTVRTMKLTLRELDAYFEDCVEKHELAERLIVTLRARDLIPTPDNWTTFVPKLRRLREGTTPPAAAAAASAAATVPGDSARDSDRQEAEDVALALKLSQLDTADTSLAGDDNNNDADLAKALQLSQTLNTGDDNDADDDSDEAELQAALKLSREELL
jgi:pimeloyl-ACP methyl ester carboxylesterase